jgi:16S rRNA (guanine527-N7)-methyltransferase
MHSIHDNLKIGSDQWADLLITGACKLGIDMDHRQAGRFGRYGQILQQWNEKINLTAITDPVEIAVKHFLDSVAPWSAIPRQGTLLDIGTGGGFPGVPLKILRPQQPMVLIDGVRKKINFVKQVVRELQLENIEVIQARAQELMRRHPESGPFDTIVSRALADSHTMIELAAPLMKPQGRLILYKGSGGEASIAQANEIQSGNARFDGSHWSYRLPVTGHRRAVLVFKRRPC